MIESGIDHTRARTTYSRKIENASGESNQNLVESAIRQNLSWWHTNKLKEKLWGERRVIEFGYIDTRNPETISDKDPLFIYITGAWGRGLEDDGMIETMAHAMGEGGMEMVTISLPGHGRSSDLPGGWVDQQGYNPFDYCAEFVAQFLKENCQDRKVIVNAYSMGGVTALKMAAAFPDLVDGLVLVDTPVFEMNFSKLWRNFFRYGFKRDNVTPEEKEKLNFPRPGISIFLERLKKAGIHYRRTRKPGGIPLELVYHSAKSMCDQDLIEDKTLNLVARHKIPTLILHGENDDVVPADQIEKLNAHLENKEAVVKKEQIKKVGHGMIAERPSDVGRTIRTWLEEKEFVPAGN